MGICPVYLAFYKTPGPSFFFFLLFDPSAFAWADLILIDISSERKLEQITTFPTCLYHPTLPQWCSQLRLGRDENYLWATRRTVLCRSNYILLLIDWFDKLSHIYSMFIWLHFLLILHLFQIQKRLIFCEIVITFSIISVFTHVECNIHGHNLYKQRDLWCYEPQ